MAPSNRHENREKSQKKAEIERLNALRRQDEAEWRAKHWAQLEAHWEQTGQTGPEWFIKTPIPWV